MERPQSIIWFDRFYLGGIAIGIVNMALTFGDNAARIDANPGLYGSISGTLMTSISAVITFGILFLLWYFISRRASRIAKWIFVILCVIGLFGLPASISFYSGLPFVLILATTVMQLLSIIMLFRPDARAWFKGEWQSPSLASRSE